MTSKDKSGKNWCFDADDGNTDVKYCKKNEQLKETGITLSLTFKKAAFLMVIIIE